MANPISLMNELIHRDKRNAQCIFPYLSGDEVNDSPTHQHYRYVINFGEMTEEQARGWPDLMKVVEEKVKPERTRRDKAWSKDKEKRAQQWWRFSRTAQDLSDAIRHLPRVIAIPRVTQWLAFTLLPTNYVFSDKVVVFATESLARFALLSSRVHDIWGRFFSSTLEDRVNYAPTDCFDTFPFPEDFEVDAKLEAVGKEYYEFRAALMVRNNEGLTKTYNRFHDPDERSSDILKLRELHAAMDRAVLDAYGWTDLKPTCEFLLDYEEDEDDEEGSGGARRRKKPWRYRWPDEFRDEVLARLLELNRHRAEMERLTGLAGQGTGANVRKGARSRKVAKGKALESTPDMFAKDVDPE